MPDYASSGAFFGQLKEITGLAEDEAELSEGARVEDLFARYGNRFARLAEFRAVRCRFGESRISPSGARRWPLATKWLFFHL